MKKIVIAIVVFAILIVGLLYVLGIVSTPPQGQSKEFTLITWVGDTLLGDAAQAHINETSYRDPFNYLFEIFFFSDYVIANIESPITTREEKWQPEQRYSYNMQPEVADALAFAGIDAAGLSNNHILDRGPEGVADTLQHLREGGIVPFGAGMDIEEALRPLLIDTEHGVIGVVGLSLSWGSARTAGENKPGTIVLSEGSIRRGYVIAREAGADYVVGFVHWGENYTNVNRDQRDAARTFADAGYDLVIGHGSHTVQPIEILDGMPVVYSLGNFVFGTAGRFTEEFPGHGVVATSHFGRDGLAALSFKCIVTDNKKLEGPFAFQPILCLEDEATVVLESLHPDVVVDEVYRGILEL